MHLLNTYTTKLHEFQGSEIPDYAILSHRWDVEEVSFRDMQDGKGVGMAGFAKIESCCAQAVSEGWRWVWIDSCCIDKSSSAELSEAINSMFRWYRDAQVCYAYLSDVPGSDVDPELAGSAFRQSVWFARGWTLQELLAPSIVIFFNRDWIEIGTKSSLCDKIMSITGIRPLTNFESACVAQKMSWASKRQTTRVEDMAYCLMGIFGVNMPPLYGEGENAFRRLQLQILSKEDDESIFAWTEDANDRDQSGLLAHSPAAFNSSGNVRRINDGIERSPFSMTNRGLRIETYLIPLTDASSYVDDTQGYSSDAFLAPLNCRLENSTSALALCLKKGSKPNQWVRYSDKLPPWNAVLFASRPPQVEYPLQVVFVKQNNPSGLGQINLAEYTSNLKITTRSLSEHGFSISDRLCFPISGGFWEVDSHELRIKMDRLVTHAAVMFTNKTSDRFVLYLDRSRVGVSILIPIGDQSLEKIATSFANSQKESELPLTVDRISKSIKLGLKVAVAIRKKNEFNKKVYEVDVIVSQTKFYTF